MSSGLPADRSARGPDPSEAPLPQLQNGAGERGRVKVECVGGDRLAVDLDGPLRDQATAFATADLEGMSEQQGQVHLPLDTVDPDWCLSRQGGRLEIIGDLVLDVDLVEAGLSPGAGALAGEAVD